VGNENRNVVLKAIDRAVGSILRQTLVADGAAAEAAAAAAAATVRGTAVAKHKADSFQSHDCHAPAKDGCPGVAVLYRSPCQWGRNC
jgi:hypothetical protein